MFLFFKDLTMPIFQFLQVHRDQLQMMKRNTRCCYAKKSRTIITRALLNLGLQSLHIQDQRLKGSKPLNGGVLLQMKALLIVRFCSTKCNSDVFKQDTGVGTVVANDTIMTITKSTTIMEVLIVTPFTLKMVIIPIQVLKDFFLWSIKSVYTYVAYSTTYCNIQLRWYNTQSNCL